MAIETTPLDVPLALDFQPLPLPHARSYRGKQFPLAFARPSDLPPPSLEESAEYLRQFAASGALTRLLDEHGAIVFRGFGHPSAETFSKLVRAAEEGRGNTAYEQVGLAGSRNIVAPDVFTANEGPPDRRFYQHNEYTRFRLWPGFIHFYAEQAPLEGGESPLANSLEYFERVQAEVPEFVDTVTKLGLRMQQVYPPPHNDPNNKNYFDYELKDTFGRDLLPGDDAETKKRKVEGRIRLLTNDFKWNEDGSVTTVNYVKAAHRFKPLNAPSWMNTLAGRYGTIKEQGADQPPFKGRDGQVYPPATYGNGEPIPTKYLDKILNMAEELEYLHKWEAGDLIFVHNLRTSHGRRPWTAGERRVLVSMWDVIPESGVEPYKA